MGRRQNKNVSAPKELLLRRIVDNPVIFHLRRGADSLQENLTLRFVVIKSSDKIELQLRSQRRIQIEISLRQLVISLLFLETADVEKPQWPIVSKLIRHLVFGNE